MLIARLKWGWKHGQDVHSASTPYTPLVASLVVTDGRRILLRAERGRPELPATYIGTDPPTDHRSGGVIRLMAKLGLTGGSALVPTVARGAAHEA